MTEYCTMAKNPCDVADLKIVLLVGLDMDTHQ